jgi:hypothetical protein
MFCIYEKPLCLQSVKGQTPARTGQVLDRPKQGLLPGLMR